MGGDFKKKTSTARDEKQKGRRHEERKEGPASKALFGLLLMLNAVPSRAIRTERAREWEPDQKGRQFRKCTTWDARPRLPGHLLIREKEERSKEGAHSVEDTVKMQGGSCHGFPLVDVY